MSDPQVELPPLRLLQREALTALYEAFAAGRRRCWVVLPPGVGKTRVGTETILHTGIRAVILCPNTAIQSQWCAAWAAHGQQSGTDRALTEPVTVLTYQSLAVFDDGDDVDHDTAEPGPSAAAESNSRPSAGAESLLDRLHPNGQALVQSLRSAGPVLLVLDECHHLLEVWGRLLVELLTELPEATVLGLTATPPTALDAGQAEVIAELFGEVTYAASMPTAVRLEHLAPYAELAWFTQPTTAESDWLGEQAIRFTRLVTDLMNPDRGSVPLLAWLDRRAADRTLAWPRRELDEPQWCDAILRLVHAQLLRLPEGARVQARHRAPPRAEDWAALLDDWVRGALQPSQHPRDEQILAELREVLPSVGLLLTRHGVRGGRSPVDRVLARSAAKVDACLSIVGAEVDTLGDRATVLVICDHESAPAAAPSALGEVLDQQAGSARLMLQRLVDDVRARHLHSVLVTGRTVAASTATIANLLRHIAHTDPALAKTLRREPWPGGSVEQLVGPWRSRIWVPVVTSFLESGQAQVVVGTRALLGEGWDARGLTTLIDLSSATTVGAVVQTRGRTVRLDPRWPEKVAITWSVVCLTDRHPRGDSDWARFVRKHTGYLGVDEVGEVVAGVGHVDASLDPTVPPAPQDFDAHNARAMMRAQRRHEVRDRWQIGTSFIDETLHVVRISPRRRIARALPLRSHVGDPPAIVLGPQGVRRSGGAPRTGSWTTVRELASRDPLPGLAAALADGLHGAGLTALGAAAVSVVVEPDGASRFALTGVSVSQSELFARSLDELVGALAAPRYVVPRYLLGSQPGWSATWAGWRQLFGRTRPDGVAWHAVPTALGVNARTLAPFVYAWHRWVCPGQALYTQSPAGWGVLVSMRGTEPLDVVSTMRVQWR